MLPKLNFSGQYKLTVRKRDSDIIVKEVGPFKNKITDIGLNRLGTAGAMNHCYVGTGTTPSSVTDTTMQSWKGTSAAVGVTLSFSNTSPRWSAMTATGRFDPGVAQGNLTEVGIGWVAANAGSTSYLWSRELVVDDLGNPTTITVLADEYLEVSYTLRWYVNESDFAGSLIVDGITYNYTGRPCYANEWRIGVYNTYMMGMHLNYLFGGNGCSLGPLTGNIENYATSISNVGTKSIAPYTQNSLRRTTTHTLLPNQANNLGGIRALTVLSSNIEGSPLLYAQQYQILFDKSIPKTADNGLRFALTQTWGRA